MYSRKVNSETLSFGVSGLLYKANVLMYDHQSDSLWSQIKREAVVGPATGKKLKVLPSTITSWEKWRSKHPKTSVLSIDTGYSRDYSRDPYADYYESQSGFFSLFNKGPGEEEKALVIGLTIDGQPKAYPVDDVRKHGEIIDGSGDAAITLRHDPENDQIHVTQGNSKLEAVIVYWFVWKGLYPESEFYRD